ncbi:phosphotransferase [Lactobacillus sp. CC-MHH1034]|uniref:phosphotransferase n=1 Tax=Agrilactobacillus fermenti TaxID=2586909 RepID=UPI001E31CBC8|nr:phosphotransferase [Agrilactobacillus fermenti]MCD2257450.1 phosphotransferase [Agrilactobacillus fermenti]
MKYLYGLSKNKIYLSANGKIIKSFPDSKQMLRSYTGQALASNALPSLVKIPKIINSNTISYDFVSGYSVPTLSLKQFLEVRRNLNRFHTISHKDHLQNINIPTYNNYIEEILKNFTSELSLISSLKIKRPHLTSTLSKSNLYLSHMDLHGNNLLWKDTASLAGIIDFDQVAWVPSHLDDVIMALRTSFDFNHFYPEKTLSLFKSKVESLQISNSSAKQFIYIYIYKVIIEKIYYFSEYHDLNIIYGSDSLDKWAIIEQLIDRSF